MKGIISPELFTIDLEFYSYEFLFQGQINKALGDASVVVKFSCVTVCLLYGLSFLPPVYSLLAVTPGL